MMIDPYLITLSVKQKDIKYYFLSIWKELTGIEHQSLRLLVNTLAIELIDECMYLSIHLMKL